MHGIKDRDIVFVCVGEPSGDLYAYLYLKKLQAGNQLDIHGVGGEKIKALNACIHLGYGDLMVFGIASGLSAVMRNYQAYRKIARAIYRTKPQVFLAFAYPGINLLLARHAKKTGIKVWYALPPQIWAWGKFRKYFVKKWVDLVITFFPFEYRYFKELRIKTELVENPLISELKKYERNDFKKRIGFMPGSRPAEIQRNLPVILEIAKRIQQSESGVELALIFHPDTQSFYKSSAKLPHSYFILHTSNHYQTMRNCDLLVTCSGTASLEAAIMAIPQVFFNRPSFIDFHIFRHFVTTKEFNLANLFYEERIVPSFVDRDVRKLVANVFQKISNPVHRSNNGPTS